MESVDQVVVESPVSDVVPVMELDILPHTSQFALLNPHGSQVSHLSSVQLLPNRMHLDFDLDTIDVFPVFAASLRSAGIYPLSHLFRPRGRLRALCRMRWLHQVTASS